MTRTQQYKFLRPTSGVFSGHILILIFPVCVKKKSFCIVFIYPWRILGSLISAHILLTDPKHPFGDVGFKDYDNELLHLAHDLAIRLLPAFENTSTGIPYPRVSEIKTLLRSLYEYMPNRWYCKDQNLTESFIFVFRVGQLEVWSSSRQHKWDLHCRSWVPSGGVWDPEPLDWRFNVWMGGETGSESPVESEK